MRVAEPFEGLLWWEAPVLRRLLSWRLFRGSCSGLAKDEEAEDCRGGDSELPKVELERRRA